MKTTIKILTMSILLTTSALSNDWEPIKHPHVSKDGSVDINKLIAIPQKQYSMKEIAEKQMEIFKWLRSISDQRHPPDEYELAKREFQETGDKEKYDARFAELWDADREALEREVDIEREKIKKHQMTYDPFGYPWANYTEEQLRNCREYQAMLAMYGVEPLYETSTTYSTEAGRSRVNDGRDRIYNDKESEGRSSYRNDDPSENSDGDFPEVADRYTEPKQASSKKKQEAFTTENPDKDKNAVTELKGKSNQLAKNRCPKDRDMEVLNFYKKTNFTQLYNMSLSERELSLPVQYYTVKSGSPELLKSDNSSDISMTNDQIVINFNGDKIAFIATYANGDYYTYDESTNSLIFSVTADCYSLDDNYDLLEKLTDEAIINVVYNTADFTYNLNFNKKILAFTVPYNVDRGK